MVFISGFILFNNNITIKLPATTIGENLKIVSIKKKKKSLIFDVLFRFKDFILNGFAEFLVFLCRQIIYQWGNFEGRSFKYTTQQVINFFLIFEIIVYNQLFSSVYMKSNNFVPC
jgi:hypothetical protein